MKKYKFSALIVLLLVVAAGCKDYLDVNTNPNAPTVTVPGLVLSGALKSTADQLALDNMDYAAYWVGMMSASGSYSGSGDVRRQFNINSSSGRLQIIWQDYYLNASNYNFVETNSAALGANYGYYVAIAKIMKVYDIQVLVDNFGPIPYFGALKGFAGLAPTYDDASAIYEDLSNQLDTAVTIIQSGQSTWSVPPSTVDIMFGGDMAKWGRLANTMNLRLLMHQSEVGGAKDAFIAGEITKITGNGMGFLGTGENAQINPGYQKAAGLQNPFWEQNGLGVGNDLGDRGYARASDYAITAFSGNGDPRLSRYFRDINSAPGENADLVYFGIPFGVDPTNAYVTQNTSGFGLGVMGSPADPMTFLSASESFFLQAEAAHRGWLGGSESALYETAISESFELVGAVGATGYITANPLPAAGTPAALEAIINEKWRAEYVIDPMEAWTDLRRLGYPNDLPESLNAAKVNATPPIRLLYPQSEYSNNSSALKSQTTKEGLEGSYQFDKPIFWDVTP